MAPDFLSTNGQRKVIEVFGDYWHKGEDPQGRIDAFAKLGFKCLVIWEHETDTIIWNCPIDEMTLLPLVNKILEFENA